jgi:hypothetical protein
MNRLLAAVAAVVLSWGLTSATETVPQVPQIPQGDIVIEEPPASGYVAGPTTFRAAVTGVPAAIVRVEFYVDGVRVCQIDREPFECTWDGGPTVRPRIVRAVAILASGGRLATSLRTSALPGFTESSSVDAVLVPFTAMDGNGRFVKGLQRADVRLKEDAVAQTISYFESEEAPLEIVVAVDISGSMEPVSTQLKQALKVFLAAFKPSDRVTLVAFNHQVFVLQRQSLDRAALAASVDRLIPAGGTALYDATLAALNLLGTGVQRRAGARSRRWPTSAAAGHWPSIGSTSSGRRSRACATSCRTSIWSAIRPRIPSGTDRSAGLKSRSLSRPSRSGPDRAILRTPAEP